MNIAELLKNPEGKTLEFKQDLSSPKGVLRTMVAFANSAGGTLIIGVQDKTRNVCGVSDPFEVEEQLANLVSDLIQPQLLVEIDVLPWRDSYLMAIQVFPSSAKPHYLKNQGLEQGVYIRVGSTNRLADALMIAELQRIKIVDSFDKQPMPVLEVEAIDFPMVEQLFATVRDVKEKDLESLDLLSTYQHRKVPTIGAIILFGKKRLEYFPDAWIQVGRFSGLNKTVIMDSQAITAYPVLAIEECLAFVKKHAMRGILINGARHTERWNVPLMAIREAIINAVVHADYAQQGAPIRLAIFDDRIEIENPGLLLFGLTIDDIKQGISKLRNRVLGQVFYHLGLIERWGSGIRRMMDLCAEFGFSEPQFEEIATHFRVTIYTAPIKKSRVNETDQAILNKINMAKEGISTKQLAAWIEKSERTVRNRLILLIAKGYVVDIGSSINDPNRKYFSAK